MIQNIFKTIDILYTWNLFVLCFGGWILPKKAEIPIKTYQNKGHFHLSSRYMYIIPKGRGVIVKFQHWQKDAL